MKRLIRWIPLLLIAAGVIAFTNNFSAPFIMDDARVVTGNPNIHNLWPPWQAVFVPTRWVADLSFALSYAMGGYIPADFRLLNILIHLLSALFLYGILRRTLRLPSMGGRWENEADVLAFLVALLWTVHPLQTNCVTYIAQRIEAIMGLFMLATLYAFIRALTSPAPRFWTNVTIALCTVGMGAKEVMVTAPLLLFAYDGLLVSPSWSSALRSRWKTYIALFLTTGVFLLLFLMSVGVAAAQNLSLLGLVVSPWRYLLTQTEVITHYLRLSFVPTDLCLNYRWPIAGGWRDVWPTAVLIGALGAVTAGGLLARWRLAYPLIWFFTILAPTSSILPIPDAAFEHRMYLPLAGVLTVAVTGGFCLWKRMTARQPRQAFAQGAFHAVVILVAVWFTTLSRARNEDYISNENLWRDVVAKRPDNYRGYIALSGAYLARDREEDAIRILNNVLTRMPDYSKMPYEEIARLWNSDQTLPCVDYAFAHSLLGLAHLNQGRTNESVRHLLEAIRVSPSRGTPNLNMGRIAMAQGKYDEALMWLKRAFAREPDNQHILCTLASVYAIRKNPEPAMKLYREVLRLNPLQGFARSQLAWMLATCPKASLRNGEEAVEIAIPLVGMSDGASPKAHDILAAAYAENGDFDKAIRHATEALRLLSANKAQPLSDEPSPAGIQPTTGLSPEEVTARLQLYKKGKPYRDAP